MKKLLIIVLVVAIAFSVSCKKNKKARELEESFERGVSIDLEEQQIGACYINEKLGFSLELSEYWYKYTKTVEYNDYAVFSFNGESELAKDVPVLYIGEKKALEKLSLVEFESVGEYFYAWNSEFDVLMEKVDKANRDVGIVQILRLELDEVLGSYIEIE